MKKSYKILIAIILIYAVIMIIFVGIPAIRKNNNEKKGTYLLVGNVSRWEYVNNTWQSITDINSVLSNNLFKCYDDGNYLGEFEVQYYNDIWYLFDKNNDSRKLSSSFLATSSAKEIEVIDLNNIMTNLDQVDLSYVNKVLEDNSLPSATLTTLGLQNKITFDFDGDKQEEMLYTISNWYDGQSQDKIYSFVFYVDNNNIQILREDIVDKIDMYDNHQYPIVAILDTNNDHKYEFIISEDKLMQGMEQCHIMYQLKKGQFNIIKSCDE